MSDEWKVESGHGERAGGIVRLDRSGQPERVARQKPGVERRDTPGPGNQHHAPRPGCQIRSPHRVNSAFCLPHFCLPPKASFSRYSVTGNSENRAGFTPFPRLASLG